jgi:DNA processing protein
VDHDATSKRQRLALLLAGGATRCRRALAAAAQEKPIEKQPLDLLRAPEAGPALAQLAHRARPLLENEVDQTLGRLDDLGWRWIVPGEASYPAALGHLADPPIGLFVRGEIRTAPTVAIVGARDATDYGLSAARLIAEEAAKAGAVVVSGMARGVDTAAHQGALSGGGCTVAVWGTGPDTVYPAENRGLAATIAKTGALLTEYPPGAGARRHHFPQRNRIVAGLASAVVIVEAAARSGALITARLALDEGRDVLAVPGSIFSRLSVGPNALLRLGARPLLTPKDLLEDIGLSPASTSTAQGRRTQETQSLPESEAGPLRFLAKGEAVTADDLAERAGTPVDQILASLLALELEGAVTRRDDGYYVRRR